jgi:hypothetical protein
LNAAELAGLLAVTREPGCKLAVTVRNLDAPDGTPVLRPLYGPIPWAWLLPAMRLPGSALRVATACWLIAGWERSAVFTLSLSRWSDLKLSRSAADRGLDGLKKAGLVAVNRWNGTHPVVTLLSRDTGTTAR